MSLKTTIIHESLKLFSLKGFMSTTIGDILQQTSTSKGGFYNHFKSKDDLFTAVLEEAQMIWRERVLSGIDVIKKPSERLKKIVRNYGEYYLKDSVKIPGGCIFLTFTVELNDQRPDCANQVNRGIIGFKKMIKRTLDQSEMMGELRHGVNTETAAMTVFIGILGMAVLYRMEKDNTILDHTIDTLIQYIDSLLI